MFPNFLLYRVKNVLKIWKFDGTNDDRIMLVCGQSDLEEIFLKGLAEDHDVSLSRIKFNAQRTWTRENYETVDQEIQCLCEADRKVWYTEQSAADLAAEKLHDCVTHLR